MTQKRILHPITITLRPFPNWDRLRIAMECLLFGELTFQGEIEIKRLDSAHPGDQREPDGDEDQRSGERRIDKREVHHLR